MAVNLKNYDEVNKFLLLSNIDSILYGSLGTSVYLGNFRIFDDIDLLIDDIWVGKKWSELKTLMLSQGFKVSDEKEHEFKNGEVKIAFAGKNVLIDDAICDPVKDVVKLNINGILVTTLNSAGFVKAYSFSSTDGYRLEKRGDSDFQIVQKLKALTS